MSNLSLTVGVLREIADALSKLPGVRARVTALDVEGYTVFVNYNEDGDTCWYTVREIVRGEYKGHDYQLPQYPPGARNSGLQSLADIFKDGATL